MAIGTTGRGRGAKVEGHRQGLKGPSGSGADRSPFRSFKTRRNRHNTYTSPTKATTKTSPTSTKAKTKTFPTKAKTKTSPTKAQTFKK